MLDFRLSPDLEVLRAKAAAVAADGVARFNRANDSWINGYSREFAKVLGDQGWIGMGWPARYGGHERPAIERLVVAEEMISAGAPIAAMWLADRQMGPALIAFGTEEQKARYLPPMLRGDTTWCIGMSEPDAGSDLAAIATRAVRDGDHFVISGRKIWTSFAALADYCYLICRTATDEPPQGSRGRVAALGSRGISEIIVPMDLSGIAVHPIEDLTGNRHFCEVTFDDVRVPAENLVGTEGDAFRQTMVQLQHERGGIDRLVSNRALYDLALSVADRRDARVRDEIARLETSYRLGRLLVYREALGQAPAGFSAATKVFCTEHEQRVAAFVCRVLGPAATGWCAVARGLAYAPAYTIMGGTSLVLRNVLAERVLGLPRGAA